MSQENAILMRLFGRPQGFMGRMGGSIMARTNRNAAAWVVELLDIQPNDSALEVGFGPGVGIQLLARLAPEGYIAGLDSSGEMVAQAIARNWTNVAIGRVDLRHGFVERLPFEDSRFDKALAINTLQVWPDVTAGLAEMRRTLKPGGRIAVAFTPYSGQVNRGLSEMLTVAGFVESRVVVAEPGFCTLAVKP